MGGSHRQIGRQIGEACAKQIRHNIESSKTLIDDSFEILELNWEGAQIQSRKYIPFAQDFFDFSGYTDIAIGMARTLGIRLPENFDRPYLKPNLTQFWNNWHMTLTQWVRAYFFNPFNRWVRGYNTLPAWMMIFFGQLATMLLIGLWHGVTVNFVLWGLWHGLGLFIHNRWGDFLRSHPIALLQDNRWQRALNVTGILFTFHFVAFGWVFFALSTPASSATVFLKLFGMK